ncbi:TPM domain-containing protein [Francisella frigiditurris]|uniref:TLP18.3, Psb32 and MOLO-1 founding s of phosphatase family protein n=1 Tax=Francisella frigiditurris TaxID=1542390 RepID=A0A1J0KSU9_9GAMM|nr:TPM domain-containing protein [Francisella frigiditurris]APC96771.1 TLP18.3, Psb32 and MOLO-1 founding s of phosphatase family protein [Francisella frigiditurris]
MKKIIPSYFYTLLIIFFIFSIPQISNALETTSKGYVTDDANLFSTGQFSILSSSLKSYYKKKNISIKIVTKKDLKIANKHELDEYLNDLYKQEFSNTDKGILILFTDSFFIKANNDLLSRSDIVWTTMAFYTEYNQSKNLVYKSMVDALNKLGSILTNSLVVSNKSNPTPDFYPYGITEKDLPDMTFEVISDNAYIFNSQQRHILKRILSHNSFQKDESFKILTIDSLPANLSLEEYSNMVFKKSRIKKRDTIMIIIVKDSNLASITVSPLLAGWLPQSFTDEIISTIIEPSLKKNEGALGIVDAVDEMTLKLDGSKLISKNDSDQNSYHSSYANNFDIDDIFYKTPTIKHLVTDEGGFFNTSQIDSLAKNLENYEKKTTNQIVIYTIKKLPSNISLEVYANKLFNQNKIGVEGHDNGVLLLLVKDNRKVRLEIGTKLEPYLTDTLSSRIIYDVITPNFRDGYYYEGSLEAIDKIESILDGNNVSFAPKPLQYKAGYYVLLILLFLILLSISFYFYQKFLAKVAGVYAKYTGSEYGGKLLYLLSLASVAACIIIINLAIFKVFNNNIINTIFDVIFSVVAGFIFLLLMAKAKKDVYNMNSLISPIEFGNNFGRLKIVSNLIVNNIYRLKNKKHFSELWYQYASTLNAALEQFKDITLTYDEAAEMINKKYAEYHKTKLNTFNFLIEFTQAEDQISFRFIVIDIFANNNYPLVSEYNVNIAKEDIENSQNWKIEKTATITNNHKFREIITINSTDTALLARLDFSKNGQSSSSYHSGGGGSYSGGSSSSGGSFRGGGGSSRGGGASGSW